MAKSYWTGVFCGTDRSRAAILSWFSPLCDGMTPIKAEILCDVETDREKKIRALVIDESGHQHWAIRSKNKGGHTITLKRAALARAEGQDTKASVP